ncbi:MAG: hypothetical protein RL030_1146, partial [Pseudomonadota bacterium]
AVFCLIPLLAHATGEIYRWKDTSGVWHYSDQPQPGAELVKAARKPVPSTTSTTTPASATSDPASSAGVPGAPPVSDEVAQQVRSEVAVAKTDQCKKATEQYDKSIQARRMYRVDDKGNQVFLDSAEIDQARLNARSARDMACGQQ